MGKREERSGIVFLIDQLTVAAELLDDWELGGLIRALLTYSVDGELPEEGSRTKQWNVIFKMMRRAQDKSIMKYEEMCEKNRRNALLRSQPLAANIGKKNKEEEKKENACGGPVPSLDGQEGATDDECAGIRWL